MESHIMNVPYHQARYRTIGHKIMRTTSDSLSSESSCNQNSPEYKRQDPRFDRSHYEDESNEAQDWQNQAVNITQSSQDTSDDEEEDEQIEVQEVQYEVRDTDSIVYDPSSSEVDNIEENSLVEGDDYDIIQVYAVDPNLDLEGSSDDEEQADYTIQNYVEAEAEYVNSDDSHYNQNSYIEKPPDILQETLNIDLDTPVVSNVDEYFIKVGNNKDILDVKDDPVVQDVDEYFIKDVAPRIPNVDDFFIKHKVSEDASTKFRIDKPPSKVPAELFREADEKKIPKSEIVQPETADTAIHESDLEVLPNIEDLKRFLMEDIPCTKLKNAQRSCSLPHSPINICMDIDDAKTCLSFEDLNLDLSDLTFDKSDNLANKSDDIPRTLTEEDVNSFLITSKPESKTEPKEEDDFSSQDMEIERPVESSINTIHDTPVVTPIARQKRSSTPIKQIPPTVLDFCVEKLTTSTPIKKEVVDIKTEPDDFIDVESCNDTVVPVLEANNLNSLLEQFEATEKLNTKTKRLVIKTEEPKVKSAPSKNSLTNGMRLQDAGVQLNKNKMRHILMPSTINATVQRSPSPVHSDHDYCTSKKRHSLPNLKGGQSLLKPEVLSSNSRILNSRHRSCKNKKIVYNLSSDDESEKCNNNNNKNKKNVNNRDDSDVKFKKLTIKQPVKLIAQATCRKKLSPPHSATNDSVKNISVINKSASKASDTPCSQNSNGSIKLTIKNKSEVILSCDLKDSHKSKHSEKSKNISVSDKSSDSDKTSNVFKETKAKDVKPVKSVKEVEVSSKTKTVHSKEPVKESAKEKVKESVKETVKDSVVSNVIIKEEPKDNFYTALFPNKQDVQVPTVLVKSEKRPFDEELQKISEITIKKETEQPQKRKKLNLHEYQMRRVNSNNSSTTVSPEAIFPDLPHLNLDKTLKSAMNQTANITDPTKNQANLEPKKIFDPIREASRKILMNSMKQKALRKRDEDIVMSKIPKVENLELQPLISDAEMMKIVGMTPTEELPAPVAPEKPQAHAEYEEIILVSIGVNTDEDDFRKLEILNEKRKSKSPQADVKSLINFKIKKSDHVLKQNVFESMKRDKRSPVDERKQEPKIDKERYKDITAALKRVEKQVDPKISSNSLFASIQDVVMKKAPEDENKEKDKFSKPKSPTERRVVHKHVKTTIVREYDAKADHGEDKVILHIRKDRTKPTVSTIVVQTDGKLRPSEQTRESQVASTPVTKEVSSSRKRNDSDMSMSSEGSPVRKSKSPREEKEKTAIKPKEKEVQKRAVSKEKRSRSKDKYEPKHRRRSRSHSRSRRRRKSRSRSRSRSGGRYRYRRSHSPYRRRRRSRSPYRRRVSPRRSPSGRRSVNDRRSPSIRKNHRRTRSRSPQLDTRRSKTPVQKKTKLSPQKSVEKINEKKQISMTPPLRKPTLSESSDSSTSSSSSSSTSSSSSSGGSSRRSGSPYKKDELFRKKFRSFSSEDRESNTPVEERRIVFVGKLEKDITKSSLRSLFSKFGHVMEVRLHSKEDGTRYGFVTYKHARDAWGAVEAASTFPRYDVGFGGRRAFCRQSYADLDGLEAKYTESAFHGQAAALPSCRTEDMSFEQMLLDMKKKLSQRKGEKNKHDDSA